jgi:hypothetical protein
MPASPERAASARWPATLVGFALWAIAASAASMSAVQAQSPRKIAPEVTSWKAAANFKKNDKDHKRRDQPRMNLSGAACVPTTPPFKSCLIANDEKKYAQFFSIDGTTLRPRKLIRLSDEKKDPDAEGVAYADGFFYVTGSHGRSRHGDSNNDSSYAVFRIPVDPATGAPKFKPDKDRVVGVESSSRLRKALRKGEFIREFFDESLAEGGINIEGIAVRNGRMHLGLRGPSLDGRAFVLSVDADAVFTKGGDLNGKVTSLQLGQDTGIRDLAAAGDGILILAGPTRDEKVPYSIWFWDGAGATATSLRTLDLSGEDGAKAEILLLLDESREAFRVLVMFDGIENGGALSFRIPR